MHTGLIGTLVPDPAPRIAPDRLPPGADATARRLHAAAFGDAEALRASHTETGVLPQARSIREAWWRAVAHAGFGYYARAGTDLALLRRRASGSDRPEWPALGAATSGSLLRQMGGHQAAAVRDGQALTGAGTASQRDGEAVPEPILRHARADALTGLAADCLGRGDARSARRLLDRCERMLGPYTPEPSGSGDPRLHLRLQWVSAETAMSAGDASAATLAAERARRIAAGGEIVSERHRVKTVLVTAAAALVAGHADEAAALAESARGASAAAGLTPLRWAACLLLSGVVDALDRRGCGVDDEALRCADVLRERTGGGVSVMCRYL